MKKFLALILSFALVLSLAAPVSAAGSQTFTFDISAQGYSNVHDITVDPGTTITVSYTLTVNDSDGVDALTQDEIYYDDSFFEFVDTYGTNGIQLGTYGEGMTTGHHQRNDDNFYIFFNNSSLKYFDDDASTSVMGTFKLKIKEDAKGSSIISNTSFGAKDSADKPYGQNGVDLKVTVAGSKEDAGVTVKGMPQSIVYGDNNFTMTATATHTGSGTGTWSWSSSDESVLKIVSGANTATVTIQVLKADTNKVKITATYSDDEYEGSGNVQQLVAPKTLTASNLEYSGSSITKTYNGDTTCAFPAGGAVVVKNGVLVGEDTLPISGTAVYDDADADDATKVTFTPTAITEGNYRLAATETLDIDAEITPIVIGNTDLEYVGNPITKAYDGTTDCTFPEGGKVAVKASVLIGEDTLTINGSAVYNDADVTDADKVTFTPTAITTGNYTLAASETLDIEASITKATQSPTITSTASLCKGGNTLDLSELVTSGSYFGNLSFEITDGDAATLEDGSTLKSADTTGTVKITVTAEGDANHEPYIGATDAITVTVSDKADAGVSLTAPESKTYGDADFTIKATVTTAGTNGTWTWTSSDESVLTVDDSGKVSVVGAGSATITAKYESDTTLGTAEAEITVNPKTLTASDLEYSGSKPTKEYDGTTSCTPPEGGSVAVKASSLVGEDELPITGTFAYNDEDVADATKVVFTPTAITEGNYRLVATQTLEIAASITKKTITITDVAATTRAYDGTKSVALTGGTLSGVETGDAANVSFTLGSGSVESANAGENKEVTTNITLTGTEAGNYTLTQPSDVKVTISQKELTITGVTATSRAYEAGNTAVTLSGGTLVGVVSGDTVSFTLGDGTVTADAGENKAVTTNITLTGADKDNYTLTQPEVTVNITKAAQATPVIDSAAPTGSSVTDGKLTGLTDAMEYKKAEDENWTDCPNGEQTGLGNGTYLVRYKETANLKAGEAATVVLKYASEVVPVTGKDVTDKKVDVKISGTNAELLITPADLTKLGDVMNTEVKTEIVTVDLTDEGLNGVEIKSIEIPANALEAIADAAADTENNDVTGLEIKMTDGTAQFDAAAIAEIKTQAGTNGVKLVVVYNEYDAEQDEYKEALTSDQKETLEKRREDNTDTQQTVYEVHLEKLDGTHICTEDLDGFGDGKASVTVKHLLPSGATNIKVFYLKTNGDVVEVPSTTEGNYVVFIATHFSDYVITYTETYNPGPGPGPGPGPSVDYNTVRIGTMTNGKVAATPTAAPKGRTITLTVTPDEGYVLASLTVTDGSNKTVKLTDLGNGKYSFTMPGSDVRVNATFTKKSVVSDCPRDYTCPIDPFTDTVNDYWWHDGIHYCVEKGLMNGVANATFAPNSPLTRGMIVTILWRMEGSPVTNYAMSFKDVKAGQWYTEAIRWAQSTGVVLGYSSEAFGPNDDITREQLAAILYRYANYKGIDVSARSDLAQFNDAGKISGWALDNVKWAVEVGMINGTSTTTIAPTDYTNRAQAAAMIQRFCENILGK